MNKRKFLHCFFLFLFLFCNNSFAQNKRVDINFPKIMVATKSFQHEVLELISQKSSYVPLYFAITIYSEGMEKPISDFFDCASLSENSFVRDYVLCTAPYFVARSQLDDSWIAFSFAFDRDDVYKVGPFSEEIYRLNTSGKIQEIAIKHKIGQKTGYEPAKKILSTSDAILCLTILWLLFGIFSITVLIILKVLQRKKITQENARKRNDEAIRMRKNESIRKFERKIIEPVTGLFTADYLKELIQKEINQFDVFGKNFSVAIFTTKESSDLDVIKEIAAIIKENLNFGVVNSYKGDGVFLALFSDKSSDEIAIFVDLVVEKIYQANITVSSEIFDFKGQMTFFGKLGLDERSQNQDKGKNPARMFVGV